MQKVTKEVKLVPAPLAKNSCKDRSGDGLLCGDIYMVTTKHGKKVVSRKCQSHGHDLPAKRRR